MWWPAHALAEQGHDVIATDDTQFHLTFDRPWEGEEPPLGTNIVGLAEPVDADVVVIQRPTHWSRVRLVEVLQSAGIAVVVEIDDDYHSLPVGHPGREHWSPMRHPERNKKVLADCCKRADLVTVTTPALAERYGAHGRVAVIPNFVPEGYLSAQGAPNGRVTIGWPGTSLTHVGDLDVVGTSVAEVQQATGCGFRAIGGTSTCERLGVDGETVEWVEMNDYPAAVAGLDIGIVPLVDNAFCRAKSALKMCEMAALGVPAVVSPTPDNMRMHRHGIGLVAHTRSDWREALTALVRSSALREDMAARGREVMAEFTIERNCYRWLSAWEQAFHNHKLRRAA